MRYVLDSNVGIKWLLAEDQSDKARLLRDEFLLGLHELLAPDIFMVEAAHAITRAQRQGRVLPREVRIFIDDLIASAPDFHPHAALLPRALEISVQGRHNVYDCLYIALAEREGCPLVTADQKLINNLGSAFPLITRLSSVL